MNLRILAVFLIVLVSLIVTSVLGIWGKQAAPAAGYQDGEVPDGYYLIVGVKSGKCLDIRQDGNERGFLQLFGCHDDFNNQKFQVINLGGGKVTLKLPYSGKCLDVYGNPPPPANGNRVQEFTCNGQANQIWDFTSVGDAIGGYRIFSHIGERICLNPSNGSVGDRTNIDIFGCDMTSNQRWRVRPTSPPGAGPSPPKPPDSPVPSAASQLEDVSDSCGPAGGGNTVCTLKVRNKSNQAIYGYVCWSNAIPPPGYNETCIPLDKHEITFAGSQVFAPPNARGIFPAGENHVLGFRPHVHY